MTNAPHGAPIYDEPDRLPGEPPHGAGIIGAVVCVLFIVFLVLLLGPCQKAHSAEWAVESQRILAGPDAVKADLVRQALAHGEEPWRAHAVYYTPAEAGANWRRWAHTATGTLVRPGVSSCTVTYRSKWLGAWIWFAGHGITHCEDVFPESSSPTMFDLAVWAQPGQSYQEWLLDPSRVIIARNRNIFTNAVLLKPPNGWKQLTSEPK